MQRYRKGFNPLGETLHVDGLLTPISIGYRNSTYIASEVFLDVVGNKRSDIIPKYDQSHWFRDAAHLRAPATKSRGGGFKVDTSQTYYAQRYSYRFEITDEDRDNTDAPFDLDRDAAEFVADKILLRKEKGFVDAWMATTKWGTDKTGTTDFIKWSDLTSTPLIDLASWQEIVSGKIALDPMHVAMGSEIWTQLKWHPDLIDTVKYTQVGKVTLDTLVSLADLTRILIGKALITTSPEGTAEASVTYSRVWTDNLLLYYRPERASLFRPAAGYNFIWGRVPGASMYVKRFRDEERETDIIEGNTYFDYEQTAKQAGLFATDVV